LKREPNSENGKGVEKAQGDPDVGGVNRGKGIRSWRNQCQEKKTLKRYECGKSGDLREKNIRKRKRNPKSEPTTLI